MSFKVGDKVRRKAQYSGWDYVDATLVIVDIGDHEHTLSRIIAGLGSI